MLFQFFVAVYGGFFGAGIGILMLAALGFLGQTNIHRMNGLKNFAAVCINGVGALTFILYRRVDWNLAPADGRRRRSRRLRRRGPGPPRRPGQCPPPRHRHRPAVRVYTLL